MNDEKEAPPTRNVIGELWYGLVLSILVYAVPVALIAILIGPHL